MKEGHASNMRVQSQKAVLQKNLADVARKLENREEKITMMAEKLGQQESEINRLTSANFELEKKSHKISEEDKKLLQAYVPTLPYAWIDALLLP